MSKNAQMLILLVVLVFIWGCGWPIIRMGLSDCPAIWYAALRLCIATGCVFVVMGLCGQLVIPDKRDLPLIFSIGFLQIGLFIILITIGLEYVPPGRSAIIAYTSPFFVTPIAVIFFKEKLTMGMVLGLMLGAVGIALLFSPWELNWHDNHVLLGNGLLVLAAIAWSIVMLHTRYATWHKPAHLLLPWQLLIATTPALILALTLVPHPVIHWTAHFWFSLLFTAILSTPIAYWIVIKVSRYFSTITTSLALLAVPVVGLVSATFMVGESLHTTMIVALSLIVLGLASMVIANR